MLNLIKKNGQHEKYDISFRGQKLTVPQLHKLLVKDELFTMTQAPFQRMFKSFSAYKQSTVFDFDVESQLHNLVNFKLNACSIDKYSVENSIELVNKYLIETFAIRHLRVVDIELSDNGLVDKKSLCTIECDSCNASTEYKRTIADTVKFGYVCKVCNGRVSLSKQDIEKNVNNEIKSKGLLLWLGKIKSDKPFGNSNCYVYCQCNCGFGEDGSWPISYHNLCNKHKWCPRCNGNLAKGETWIELLNHVNSDWTFTKVNLNDELVNYSRVNAHCKLHDNHWKPIVSYLMDDDTDHITAMTSGVCPLFINIPRCLKGNHGVLHTPLGAPGRPGHRIGIMVYVF